MLGENGQKLKQNGSDENLGKCWWFPGFISYPGLTVIINWNISKGNYYPKKNMVREEGKPETD